MLELANKISIMFTGVHPDDKTWILLGVLTISGIVLAIPLAIFGDRIDDYLENRKKTKR